jgi:hypothetical protein
VTFVSAFVPFVFAVEFWSALENDFRTFLLMPNSRSSVVGDEPRNDFGHARLAIRQFLQFGLANPVPLLVVYE